MITTSKTLSNTRKAPDKKSWAEYGYPCPGLRQANPDRRARNHAFISRIRVLSLENYQESFDMIH